MSMLIFGTKPGKPNDQMMYVVFLQAPTDLHAFRTCIAYLY